MYLQSNCYHARMADKWVGVFTLAVLIGFVSYIESSSLLSRELAISAPSMLAQTAAPTNLTAPAYDLCPKESTTEAYWATSDKAKQYPAKRTVLTFSGRREMTNLYGKSCSYKKKNDKAPGEIFVKSECRGPRDCRALEYEDENGVVKPVTDPIDSKKYDSTACVGGGIFITTGCTAEVQPGLSTPNQPYEPYKETPTTPAPGAAPTGANPVAPAADKRADLSGTAPVATTPVTTGRTESSAPAIQQIQNYQAPGTVSAQPTSGAAPQYSGSAPTSQTTPTSNFDSSNPALHQPTGYNPSSPTGQLAGNFPTYNPQTQSYTPSTAPWQYSAPTYQSGGQKQSGNKIFSAVTSFISGFLSVQSQPVGTPYQSPAVSSPQVKYNVYVPGTVQPGPGSVTYIIVNNPASQQQPNYAPTNPSSPSQPDINEINRRIIALGTQGRRSPQDFVETDRPGPNSPLPSTYSVTTVGLESAFSEPKGLRPTPGPLAPEDAQSTSSAKWAGTRVVVTGIPIDITALIASYISGWLPKTNTSFQAQAALAQAQSDYESTVAQIAALQEAQVSGLCDETCEISLTSLQSEVPIRQTNITTLRDTVRKKEGAQLELPAPATQISRVVEDFVRSQNPSIGAPAIALSAEILSSISVPRGADVASAPTQLPSPASAQASAQSPRGPAPAVSVASQEENTSAQGEVKSESAIVNVISRVWNALKSWFLPSATTAAPQKYCSLFSRIFGGCK